MIVDDVPNERVKWRRNRFQLLVTPILSLPLFILYGSAFFGPLYLICAISIISFMFDAYKKTLRTSMSLKRLWMLTTFIQIGVIGAWSIMGAFSQGSSRVSVDQVLNDLMAPTSAVVAKAGHLAQANLGKKEADKLSDLVMDPLYDDPLHNSSVSDPLFLFGRRSDYYTPYREAPAEPLITFSVVLVSHNEHKYVKPTIDWVIQRTHKRILKEIILFDDASSPPMDQDVDVTDYPLLRVVRHEERVGLIKARTYGAAAATGDIIVFLDCHVKPRENWESSILTRINENYRHVVVPSIPVLDEQTFEETGTGIGYKMMMDWDLSFHWFEDGNNEVPVMSGGLLAISRRWWHESGEYDLEMKQWGAENIEQSIRLWSCGGEISVARDSYVAHVFRASFPYKLNHNEVQTNKVRTVLEWFDDYAEYYFKKTNRPARYSEDGTYNYKDIDISARNKLKDNLGCHDFTWFIDRFREVFTFRKMIPARTFQMRLVLANSDNSDHSMEIAIPTVPQPPNYGPSEVLTISRGYCLLPILALPTYVDEMMEYELGEDFTERANDEYHNMAGIMQGYTDEERRKWIENAKSGNITLGLMLAPCHENAQSLNFRHGAFDLDHLVYVGSNHHVFNHCVHFGASSGTNVALTSCRYNDYISDEEKKQEHGSVLSFINPIHQFEAETLESNIFHSQDLSHMAIINDYGGLKTCLHGDIPKGVEGPYVPVINAATSGDLTVECQFWAEVNQHWRVADEPKLPEEDDDKNKKKGLRGSKSL